MTEEKNSLSTNPSAPIITPTIIDKSDPNSWDKVRLTIRNDVVIPSYIEQAKNNMNGRKRWELVAQVFAVVGELIVIAELILLGLSQHSNDLLLSFYSMILSLVAIAVRRFVGYAEKWSLNCTNELNIILKKINLDTVQPLSQPPQDS